MLNEKTEKTEKVIHLMVTSQCLRNCKYCCNKQYDLNSIPYVTDEELKKCKVLCITGGEPFSFTNPNEFAIFYKRRYPNIEKVYVYTNAKELKDYLDKYNPTVENWKIDGLNVSIKHNLDRECFSQIKDNPLIKSMKHNPLYVYEELYPEDSGNFTVKLRKWQKEFVPADDSIFRKI